MFGLFRPGALTAVLAELDELRPKFQQPQEAVALVFDEARARVSREKVNTIASIRDQKWAPRDLALLLISKTAFRHAASGQHHIYRNAPTSTGSALRSIFEQAGREMVASGFIEQTENDEDQRTLLRAMSEVG